MVMPLYCLCGVYPCIPKKGCGLLHDWQVCAMRTMTWEVLWAPRSSNEEEIQFLAHPRLQTVSSFFAAGEEHDSASCLRKAGCQDTARRLKSLQLKIMRCFWLRPLAQPSRKVPVVLSTLDMKKCHAQRNSKLC